MQNQFDLIRPGDKVLVAFSGGVDSVVLLDMLLEHRRSLDFTLDLFHLNHGIRQESVAEEAFVISVAQEHQLVLHLKRADVPAEAERRRVGIEEAARLVRYELIEELIDQEGYDYVALAHHQDDNIETFFLNLFRGSGPRGLSGMAMIEGYKYRPLLSMSKASITDYARAKGLEHVQDMTNFDTRYKRNRLRQEVIPYLKEVADPALSDHITTTMRLLAQDEAYFDELLQAFDFASSEYETETLRALAPAVFSRLIRAILRQRNDLKDISAAQIELLDRLIRQSDAGELILGDTRFSLEQTKLFVRDKDEPLVDIETMELIEGSNRIPGGTIELFYSEEPAGDLAIPVTSFQGKLRIRSRRTGDRISLSPTVTKYLKNYFIDEKISRSKRDRIPLLTDDHRVFWILGYRKAYLPKKPAPFICLRFTTNDN
ncbi:MAG TPA: tRNA lysidine(34) synthetase TilS [Tissierellia bacterium]|nr:tRNA lysidine(34) synthetase TilS [Tissierellia bacterium]